jgi:hypothetical protein
MLDPLAPTWVRPVWSEALTIAQKRGEDGYVEE